MTYPTDLTTFEHEVRAERARQDAKWGEQNHPDGTGDQAAFMHGEPLPKPHERVPVTMGTFAYIARSVTDTYARVGQVTWADILLEEVAEAFAEDDPERLVRELVQVQAVAQQWREAIARRTTAGDPVVKVEVDRSDLRAAVTSAVPHMAKPNVPGFEDGLGAVRLQLTGHGLLVSATDRFTLAASLIEAEVQDDEADPVDLGASSIRSLLTVFPAPGKESMGQERIRVESLVDRERPGEPSTVTFTDVGGMFDGDALTLSEYPSEGFPDVALALRGMLARQGEELASVEVSADLLHRFEAASKAFNARVEFRPIPRAPGSDRGVLLVAVGTQFLGAVQVSFDDAAEFPVTGSRLSRLPGQRVEDVAESSLVWTTSTPDPRAGGRAVTTAQTPAIDVESLLAGTTDLTPVCDAQDCSTPAQFWIRYRHHDGGACVLSLGCRDHVLQDLAAFRRRNLLRLLAICAGHRRAMTLDGLGRL